ncbi:MAG: PD-(D/E)XK nuclease family protein [Moorellales bacterium]
MLRLLLGRAGRGKTFRCLEEIRRELRRHPWGPPLLLLVPEQATFQMEQALVSGDVAGTVRARVVSFRRLAAETLRSGPRGGPKPLGELGKSMVLGLVLRRCRPKLKLLGACAHRPGLVGELARAFQEFCQYRVEPGEIIRRLEGEISSVLSAKLDDLGVLWETYRAFLAQRFYDPDDLLTLAARRLVETRPLAGASLWIDGFAGFTPQEYQFLAALLVQVSTATVALCLDPEEHQEPELSTFYPPLQTHYRLRDLASRLGLECCEEKLGTQGAATGSGAVPSRFTANPALAHLEQEFTRPVPRAYPGPPVGIQLVCAPDPWSEVEAAARRIHRLVEEGLRWRDIAVTMRNLEDYRGIIEVVFGFRGIPYFLDYRRPARNHPVVRLILAATEVLATGWQSEPVIRALKTDLWPFTRAEVDGLENYVIAYGVNGSHWTQEEPWEYHRYTEIDTRGFAWLLGRIDSLRRQVVALFGPWGQNSPTDRRSVREWATDLWRFLENLKVAATLERWQEEAEAAGNPEPAEEHGQVWRQLLSLLEELVEVLGEERVPAADFAEVLQAGMDHLTLGLIPPGLDQVLVGAVERSRQPELRATFVLGLNEGRFPARLVQQGLIDDNEREVLLEKGIELAPARHRQLLGEDFLAYVAFTRPREFLWLSYPSTDEEGGHLRPSPYVARIKAIFPALEETRLSPEAETAPDSENGAVPSSSATLPGQIVAGFYPDPVVLSVSQLEAFARCPFSHFATYLLDLRPRARARLEASKLGLWLHAALHRVSVELESEGLDWGELSPEEAYRRSRAAVERLLPRFRSLLPDEGIGLWTEWVSGLVAKGLRVLAAHARAGRFRPLAAELGFGPKADLPPLPLSLPDGREVYLSGRLDRLEAARGATRWYLRVIDYKIGETTLTWETVRRGLTLALPLYLEVAKANPTLLPEEPRSPCPAGLFYLPLTSSPAASRGPLGPEEAGSAAHQGFRLPGWVLKEEEALSLMVSDATRRADLLPLGASRGETVRALTEAAMLDLLAGARDRAASLALSILSGDISARPSRYGGRSECEVCPYTAVCQREVRP